MVSSSRRSSDPVAPGSARTTRQLSNLCSTVLACAGQGAKPPSSASEASEASEVSKASREGRGDETAPVIRFSFIIRHDLSPPAVECNSKMLATSPPLFTRVKRRAPVGVIECRTGRSGTRRTTREGRSPVESGTVLRALCALPGDRDTQRLVTAVSRSGASSDTEPESPTPNNRGEGRRAPSAVEWGSSHQALRLQAVEANATGLVPVDEADNSETTN